MDPLGTFLSKINPTDFSFTVMAFLIVIFVIMAGWFKLIPWYIHEERPAQRDLKAKRVQAELEIKRDELAETRLMRQTLERIGSVSDKISLMIDLHDKQARGGIDQILGLLRIVLEKQGVQASEITKFLNAPDQNQAVLNRLADALQIPKAPN